MNEKPASDHHETRGEVGLLTEPVCLAVRDRLPSPNPDLGQKHQQTQVRERWGRRPWMAFYGTGEGAAIPSASKDDNRPCSRSGSVGGRYGRQGQNSGGR
jgi:hypothetical protein